MLVDLVNVVNDDGVRLDGAFLAPKDGSSAEGPVDAVLLIHGSTGNFYTGSNITMAEALRAYGYPCLSLNTTAHDTVWYNANNSTYYGVAYENLDRSRLDLKAGIDYLADQGFMRIALIGNSMGAVRVGYYAATESDKRLATIIPVSPVRLSYTYMLNSEDAGEFQHMIEQADELEAKGKAQELMAVKYPIPQMFSAASYLDKHGPAERYNLVTLAPKIKVPVFVVSGSLETHSRLRDAARDIAIAAVNRPRAEYKVIEGGVHSLGNRLEETAVAVSSWLASLACQ